jgi:A/G-specific adenine glycosylase
VLHPLVPPVLDWFDTAERDLPWRAADRTPWGVLVSEVMLQQTPVARVEPVWRRWMDRWPTPSDLAAESPAEVLRAWDRLGYPRRALRLQQCARAVVEQHDGELPRTEDALLALPGIGTYTAAAVMAFAHGRRSVVVDTNVRRVLSRALAGEALPPPSLTRAELREAGTVVPDDHARASRWSAAVMELGALVCTARAPHCDVCPVMDQCAWRLAGRPADPLAHVRRRQAWHGTDRQVRGRIMAVLRDADHVPDDVLLASLGGSVGGSAAGGAPDASTASAGRGVDEAQYRRCLAGLLADGLVVAVEAGDDAPPRFGLPQ